MVFSITVKCCSFISIPTTLSHAVSRNNEDYYTSSFYTRGDNTTKSIPLTMAEEIHDLQLDLNPSATDLETKGRP
jgi:hypothetical protein